jgi:selenocysteine-specific elongation factor
VLLTKSARLIGKKSRAARPLKDQSRIHFHHGSACCAGRVFLLGRSELGPGEQALAQVRLEAPLFAFSGDRFIIRDAAEQATLCGGVILDADANQRNFRSERQKQFLERIAGLATDSGGKNPAWENLPLRLEAQLERDGAVARSGLLVKSGFSAAEIERALSQLAAAGKAFLSTHLAARADWWAALRAKAAALIEAEHHTHPQNKGLPLPQLRAALQNDLAIQEVFDCLIAELYRSGFVQTGAAIGSQAHRPALPPQLQAAGAKLRAALACKPLEPPSRKELAPDGLSQQALRFLIETGEATELGAETVLLTEHFDRAVGSIKQMLRERGPSTVSDLRQALGTSRRIMVPLLERLDREGTTVRQGDKRVLKG